MLDGGGRAKLMIRAVFWDNDGVLVDTEMLYYRSTREVLRRVGVDLTVAAFIDISLKQGRSVFDLAKRHGVTADAVEELRDDRNRLYGDLLGRGVRIMDGVEPSLRELRGRVFLGVVTSSRREHFQRMHERTDLLDYFDFVLTREDFCELKPHPEPYLKALQRVGLDAEQCVVVEDSERGLQAAAAAGIRCLVVPNELTRDQDFHKAWRILRGASEVAEEVLSIRAEKDAATD